MIVIYYIIILMEKLLQCYFLKFKEEYQKNGYMIHYIEQLMVEQQQ